MRNYIGKRLLSIIPILIGISFLSFILINLSPSDPAEVALRVNEITPTEEAIQGMREELGLDKSFLERYTIWLTNCLKGDFGQSYVNKKSVGDEIARVLPATLKLAIVSIVITIVISVSSGVFCAVFEDSIGDRIIRGIIFIGSSMPSFWIGLLLMWIFAVKLDLLPTSGMETPSSIILPSITLSLVYISTYARLIRNNMIKNKNENYVLYARVRGLKETTIIKHIFKNSLQSCISALGMSIPKLIAGTVVVENIFAWPGVGRLCVNAIFNRDYPTIQAYILIMAVLFIVCNLLVDIVTVSLDPRMRMEA